MKKYIILLLILISSGLAAQITVNTNFTPNIASHIDSRAIITNLSDTTSIAFKYTGMLVFVTATKKFYYYETSWKELLAGVVTIDSTSVVNSYGTIITESPANQWNIKIDTSLLATQFDLLGLTFETDTALIRQIVSDSIAGIDFQDVIDSTALTAGYGISVSELANNWTVGVDTSKIATLYDLTEITFETDTALIATMISDSLATIVDENTTYTAGWGLDLTGTEFKADTSELVTQYDLSVLSITDSLIYNTTIDSLYLRDGQGYYLAPRIFDENEYSVPELIPNPRKYDFWISVNSLPYGTYYYDGTQWQFFDGDNSATNEFQTLSYTTSTRKLKITTAYGNEITLPLFSTTDTNAGLVSGGSGISDKFLRGDNTWQTIDGGGGIDSTALTGGYGIDVSETDNDWTVAVDTSVIATKFDLTNTISFSVNKIVFFGDSFSDGETDFTGKTAAYLGVNDYILHATSGHSISQMVTAMESTLSSNPTFFSGVDVVSVLIGLNDFSGNTALGNLSSASGHSSYAGKMKQFIETVLAENPAIVIYWCTVPETDSESLPYKRTSSQGWTLNDLKNLIVEIAGYYSVNVVDFYSNSGINEETIGTYLSNDKIHPSDAGHTRLAKVLTSAIQKHYSVGSFTGTTFPADNVTGTGTATRVAFWSGANTLSSNTNLYWDNANSRLGLGANNPAQQLEITGNFRLPASSSTVGNIYKGTDLFLHNFGTDQTFLGINAGNFTMSGSYNYGIGRGSLQANTSGNYNVALGSYSLYYNTTGSSNFGLGYYSMNANTTGIANIGIGTSSLATNTTGNQNIAIGRGALAANIDNWGTVGIGEYAGFNARTSGSIMIGYLAGNQSSAAAKGNYQIVIGAEAGKSLGAGIDNIIMGRKVELAAPNSDAQLNIGNVIYATGLATGSTPSATGAVGIGTSTPAKQFHTTGTVRMAGISAATETSAIMIDGNGDLSKRALNAAAFNGTIDSTTVVNGYGTTITESPANQFNITVDTTKIATLYDLTQIEGGGGAPDQTLSIDSTGRVFTISLTGGGSVSFQDTDTNTDIYWTGTSTNLVAATGRTSLGGTTIGQSMFTLANPGAITFPRFNANNTVSALTASDFRSAIGAGTGNGTVTSIATGNGITGGTITTTGTLGLTGQALALHNLASSGLIARTGAGTVEARTLTAGTGISISNADGVSGNPTITNTGVTSFNGSTGAITYSGLTGSGTATHIPYFSGTSTLASSANMTFATAGAMTITGGSSPFIGGLNLLGSTGSIITMQQGNAQYNLTYGYAGIQSFYGFYPGSTGFAQSLEIRNSYLKKRFEFDQYNGQLRFYKLTGNVPSQTESQSIQIDGQTGAIKLGTSEGTDQMFLKSGGPGEPAIWAIPTATVDHKFIKMHKSGEGSAQTINHTDRRRVKFNATAFNLEGFEVTDSTIQVPFAGYYELNFSAMYATGAGVTGQSSCSYSIMIGSNTAPGVEYLWNYAEPSKATTLNISTIIYVPSQVSANKVSIGIQKFVNSGDGSIAQAEITLKRIE
jgi:lysophospholipase L1-like esterase